MPDRRAYHATLPMKRMGAGCLFFDEGGRLLLVEPAYKPVWEIPGGVVEADESPRACCQREIEEELGLNRPVGPLLVIDYNEATDKKLESLMFIFAGGTLSADDIARIQLPPGELRSYNFFTTDNLPPMSPSLRRRVLAAWDQAGKTGAVYLENQGAGA